MFWCSLRGVSLMPVVSPSRYAEALTPQPLQLTRAFAAPSWPHNLNGWHEGALPMKQTLPFPRSSDPTAS